MHNSSIKERKHNVDSGHVSALTACFGYCYFTVVFLTISAALVCYDKRQIMQYVHI